MNLQNWFGAGLDSLHEGELAQRSERVTEAAANVLGDYQRARQWVQEGNFAFGGASPHELLKTDAGEHTVLNELRAQAERKGADRHGET